MLNCPINQKAESEDFLAHLRERLGLADEAAAMATLSEWISSYRPGPAALTRATSRPEQRRSAA